jgi:SAM-dependent methyltransferase
VGSDVLVSPEEAFRNPFSIEDIQVFDDEMVRYLLERQSFGITYQELARALHGTSSELIQRINRLLPAQQQEQFTVLVQQTLPAIEIEQARQRILDKLFWELIYWKVPEMYEELTEGEHLHPGIFASLASLLQGSTVLDVGAGSGRASFECRWYGAARVYAVEPSPGLLHILADKIRQRSEQWSILPCSGRFDALPLADQSVDVSLSCSAFTAANEMGGEAGLAELYRVTRAGGTIVIIWPRRVDHAWFKQHGFHYVSLPYKGEMSIHFRSFKAALHCAHLFYGNKKHVVRYLHIHQKPELPFSIIGMNPPCDYFWVAV